MKYNPEVTVGQGSALLALIASKLTGKSFTANDAAVEKLWRPLSFPARLTLDTGVDGPELYAFAEETYGDSVRLVIRAKDQNDPVGTNNALEAIFEQLPPFFQRHYYGDAIYFPLKEGKVSMALANLALRFGLPAPGAQPGTPAPGYRP